MGIKTLTNKSVKFYLILALAFNFIAVTMCAALEVGEQAPNFSLTDQNGKTINLQDLRGKVVVLEWLNPDCPFVKRHAKVATMKNLSAEYSSKGVVWLGVNSTHFMSGKDNLKWANDNGLNYSILDDHAGNVGKLYGARTTPHMFIIDSSGKLAYQGAIDNDPHADTAADMKQQYVRMGLDEILEGDSPKLANATPYGCSVKYKG